MRRSLVVGGTGPSGYAIVERLLARGDEVTIFHTGQHEVEFSGPVEHLHGDPRELDDLQRLLAGRSFELAISTSGRIRFVVETLRGRIGKLIAVSGLPYYRRSRKVRGSHLEQHAIHQRSFLPAGEMGIPLPIRETDERVTDPEDRYGHLVVRSEDVVMEAHRRGDFDATLVRYTMVYGRHAYIPFEWYLVRRILDRRPVIALEAAGLMVPQRGYAGNLAEAVLLCSEHPAASGQAYNVGDERSLSVFDLTVLAAETLGHEWEIVEVPMCLSPCKNPFALRQNTLFDMSKIRYELGYRDVLPVEQATREFLLWLRDNPIGRDSPEERVLGEGIFDYEAEDRVIELCRALYIKAR
jgi:nucleoside-diphosphate-sugar epimerase